MPHNPDAFAEMVVLTVKTALAPVLERLAAAEARLEIAASQATVMAELRDRVVVVETKSAMPAPVLPVPEPIDFSPILERVAAAEARLDVLGDLRDRVVTAELKATLPDPIDGLLNNLRDRVMALESKSVTVAVQTDVMDRIDALEDRPLVAPAPTVDLAPILDRLSKVEMRLDLKADETVPIKAALADATKDIGDIRERIAMVEVRAQVPGPAGKDGDRGENGKDGLGFDDLSVDFDGDRTILLKFECGQQRKTFPIQLPYLKYEGLYQENRAYVRGDVVTWGGNMWYCGDTDTISRPGASKSWQLCVKRGAEGKPGQDYKPDQPLPVVTVGGQR